MVYEILPETDSSLTAIPL